MNINRTRNAILLISAILFPSVAGGQTVEWIRQFGTSKGDSSSGVSTDAFGNVYIAGSTNGDIDGAGPGTNAGGYDAFVWDAAHGMRSLRDVLINDHGLDLTGWHLDEATGISDDGLTIVGYGTNPQRDVEAWIATVPEPSALLICLTAFGIVGSSRRRRR